MKRAQYIGIGKRAIYTQYTHCNLTLPPSQPLVANAPRVSSFRNHCDFCGWYECVISHIWLSHVTHMIESCHYNSLSFNPQQI